MTRSLIGVAALISTGTLLAACGSGGGATSTDTTASGSAGVQVVASTTMLGDVVGQIATCGGGTATTLMPIGADPHDFGASSEQVASMVTADLVVVNGLGLESGMQESLESARTDGARILAVGDEIDPLPASDSDHGDEHGDEHGEFDPHFWLDMQRMATAAQLIGDELADASGDDAFRACGTTVADDIRAADADVSRLLDSVPADRRVLVTDHDAYGYLADRYGYEIVGTVIPSTTTLAQPSSADLAELAATMQSEGVDAIFADVAAPTALAEAVAAETGRDVRIIPLYSGSLGGPDSPAATYLDYMRTNAQLIAEGLAG